MAAALPEPEQNDQDVSTGHLTPRGHSGRLLHHLTGNPIVGVGRCPMVSERGHRGGSWPLTFALMPVDVGLDCRSGEEKTQVFLFILNFFFGTAFQLDTAIPFVVEPASTSSPLMTLSSLFFRSHPYTVSSEPEGPYCSSKMFRWEPEGRYRWTKSMAIAPFWFSTEHRWTAITPFWLSTDDTVKFYGTDEIASTLNRPSTLIGNYWTYAR